MTKNERARVMDAVDGLSTEAIALLARLARMMADAGDHPPRERRRSK